MSKRRSRKDNDDSEWDCHKDTIKQLYITENKLLEGTDGVVERMQNLYNFYKTPRQYQTHFRKWGFRKNRRGEDWKIVGRKIAVRKEAGKDSAVYLEGKLLPETTIDRRTYRNSYDLAFKQHNQGSMPETPQGFAFLTPVAEDRELFQTSNLPFMEFQAAIRLKRSAPTSPNNPDNIDNNHLSHHTSPYGYPASSVSRTSSEEAPLPESSQATELHQNTANMYYATVIPTLKSLLPTAALEEYSESGSRKIPPFEILHEAHLKLLFFSVANNFAGVAEFPLKGIWDFVRNQISVPGLMQLAPGPTTKALAEKLFNCAIESGDVQAVEHLLQKRYADAKEQICIIEDVRYTPVERSAKLRDITMTKLLIHYKADVNKTYVKAKHEGNGALQRTIGKYERMIHADPALVQVLLDSGANIDSDIIKSVINRGDAQVAEILVRKGAYDNHEAWTKDGILHAAVKHLDSETATRIVQVMLQVKANINYFLDHSGGGTCPRRVLDMAAQRGYIGLVQMLLRCGAFLTEDTLTCAIQSANMDLVQYVLQEGAKIDSCATFFKTPYSEAIRNGNMDLVRLLEDQGALCHIEEKSRFKAAVCAASEVGNLGVLQSLIQRGADTHEEELGYALFAASKAGHEEAALLLIDAGANVNVYSGPSSDNGPPLYEALKRKMGGLVRALLNVDADVNWGSDRYSEPWRPPCLQFAIEWGDHSIIKDLIFAGANVNAAINLYNIQAPLSAAVMKGDTELIRLLLAKGADVNNPSARHSTALAAAVINGDINLIRFLLEEGAEPCDETALLEAISQSSDLVHLLLEAFAKRYPRGKKGYGSRALAKAIQEDDVPLLEALLKVNADVGSFCWERGIGKTPLALAIEKNNLARVQRLLDRENDLNSIIWAPSRSRYSNTEPPRLTALLVAVRTKDPQMVQLLINKGADVNFAATRGVKHTPLQMAAKIGNLAVLQVLIRNGAEVNADPAERGGATALQFAAIGGFVGIAEELLKRGAHVNAPPAKLHGRTALEGAIEHGRIDMVRFLLNAHAEIKGPGHRQYERAMEYAKENGHRVIREMLESFPHSDQNIRAGFILPENE